MATGLSQDMQDAVIGNDGFFPDLALLDFVEPYSVPNQYDDTAIIISVEQAVIKVNLQISAFKTAQMAVGYVTLTDYIVANPEPVGNDDLLLQLYKKSVFCTAKAWTLNQSNGGIAKVQDDNASVQDLNSTAQFWLNEGQSAIYTFLAKFGLQSEPTLVDTGRSSVSLL